MGVEIRIVLRKYKRLCTPPTYRKSMEDQSSEFSQDNSLCIIEDLPHLLQGCEPFLYPLPLLLSLHCYFR